MPQDSGFNEVIIKKPTERLIVLDPINETCENWVNPKLFKHHKSIAYKFFWCKIIRQYIFQKEGYGKCYN